MTAPTTDRRLPWWVRWLHIYLSMFGFCATLLFAVTGLTLNHADWFESGEAAVRTLDDTLPKASLAGTIERLTIAETLRERHHLRGKVSEFAVDDEQCVVVWKGPAYSADVTITRSTGAYHLEESRRPWLAMLDDLHKGRDCGPFWVVVIDIAAIVLSLMSVTGLWLLFYLKKRRRNGLLVMLAGTVLLCVCYVLGVP